MERVVLHQLCKHISDQGLDSKMQSAFKARHSTETALMRVQYDISAQLDNNQAVMLVLLDLSAAFDSINVDLLLDTLDKRFFIRGLVLDWVKSYLTDRFQRVKVGNFSSSPVPLKYGVPQGSVLGPILFTMFIAPLSDLIESHNVMYHQFADDVQLYIPFDPSFTGDCDRAKLQLSSCISDIRTWMLTSSLKLNDDKTEFIIFSSTYHRQKYGLHNISLQVGTVAVPGSDYIRNLGAYFDNSLSMSKHVNQVCSSANFHLWQLRKIRPYLTHDACKCAVQSLVISRIDYASGLLSGLSGGLLNKLQLVQNTAARLISGIGIRSHITPIISHLHWLKVQSRIRFRLYVHLFKILHGLAPNYLSELIHLYVPDPRLRSASNGPLIRRQYGSKQVSRYNFAVTGSSLWNELPVHIRSASDIINFKKQLKTYLLTK